MRVLFRQCNKCHRKLKVSIKETGEVDGGHYGGPDKLVVNDSLKEQEPSSWLCNECRLDEVLLDVIDEGESEKVNKVDELRQKKEKRSETC